MMSHFLFLIVGLVNLMNSGQAEKVPSAANIGEYDDPMLDAIFADTNANPADDLRFAASAIQGHLKADTVDSQQRIVEHFEKMDSKRPVVDGAKSVIDPNAKPLPGSVFSNPVVNNFPGVVSKYNEGPHDRFTAPTSGGLDPSNNAFAGPFTDLAFQAGQTFYSGVRQAGHLLGIDAGQYRPYEVPIISEGARFFGKRR